MHGMEEGKQRLERQSSLQTVSEACPSYSVNLQVSIIAQEKRGEGGWGGGGKRQENKKRKRPIFRAAEQLVVFNAQSTGPVTSRWLQLNS